MKIFYLFVMVLSGWAIIDYSDFSETVIKPILLIFND